MKGGTRASGLALRTSCGPLCIPRNFYSTQTQIYGNVKNNLFSIASDMLSTIIFQCCMDKDFFPSGWKPSSVFIAFPFTSNK